MKPNALTLLCACAISTLLGLTACSREAKQDVRSSRTAAVARHDTYYCSMHPQVTSDKPGSCPICNMDLVKKTEDAVQPSGSPAPDYLTITDRGQLLANVSTSRVSSENITKSITAFGYLDLAEPARKQITARFNGRIERLFADASGGTIRTGDPLFEIYSPDLVQAQSEYLIALKTLRQPGNPSQIAKMKESNAALVESSRRKLELFGLTSEQIAALDGTGKIGLTVVYHAPCSGTIVDKQIREGMYVSEGSLLYEVADMSTLWNISEINADDIGLVHAGSSVSIAIQSFPGKRFLGRVTLVYPVVNAESRTIKVRSEIDNRLGILRPQMYTETTFRTGLGRQIMIPGNAIVYTGKRNIAWVKSREGMFEPRELTLGTKVMDRYQVLSGIQEGEEIAVTGSYLIDSESQLKNGTEGNAAVGPRVNAGGTRRPNAAGRLLN